MLIRVFNGNGASMEAAPPSAEAARITRETYASVNVDSVAPMHTSVLPWMVACSNDNARHSIADFGFFGNIRSHLRS